MKGKYVRGTQAKDWVVEMWARDENKDKWNVIAYPKILAKSNGGYDYKVILKNELTRETLDTVRKAGIHFSPKARYVSVPGVFCKRTASYVKDGLASRIKNILVKLR